MYQKYQTEGIVVGERHNGEADKTVILYTRDFGLVYARATGVRKESSKMRYALQCYSRANVSLVRGKRGWRLAGATALVNACADVDLVRTFARISELVLRLVAGEEENEYLFEALSQAHDALMVSTAEAAPMIEIVAVARVLYALGYLSAEALETALFTHTMYAQVHLREAETMREELLSSINRALSGTHL